MFDDLDSQTAAQLQSKSEQARALADICDRHGEADGATAARSIARALMAESNARRG
jgi:hypothetical protein